MKKYLCTMLLVLVLGISTKGADSLCVKAHGSEILKDKKWHTLTYETKDSYVADILICQITNDGLYEFKSTSEKAMFDFYRWLTYYFYIEDIKMEKESNGVYVGQFSNDYFVPNIDGYWNFIGIDVFK